MRRPQFGLYCAAYLRVLTRTMEAGMLSVALDARARIELAPNIVTSSEFGDRQDFEHSKIVVFRRSGKGDFGLGSRQRGEMFEPVLGCARDKIL